MNLAKISANGQITIPVEVRRMLGVNPGDKILFFQKQDGEWVVRNASAHPPHRARAAFSGEDDVLALVDEACYGK